MGDNAFILNLVKEIRERKGRSFFKKSKEKSVSRWEKVKPDGTFEFAIPFDKVRLPLNIYVIQNIKSV